MHQSNTMEPKFDIEVTPEFFTMDLATSPSASVEMAFVKKLPLDSEFNNMKILKQENAELLAKIASLESAQKTSQSLLSSTYEKNKKQALEIDALQSQIGYLEECVQSSRIKEQETANKLESFRSSFAKRFGIIKRERRANENAQEGNEAIKKLEQLNIKYQEEDHASAVENFKTAVRELRTAAALYEEKQRRRKLGETREAFVIQLFKTTIERGQIMEAKRAVENKAADEKL